MDKIKEIENRIIGTCHNHLITDVVEEIEADLKELREEAQKEMGAIKLTIIFTGLMALWFIITLMWGFHL